MGQIITTDEFDDRLYLLIDILFINQYFSYFENSVYYVDKIYDFIYDNIHLSNHKPTPTALNYLGNYYIFFKPNNHTTWYILFDKRGDDILITSIFNNHCIEASFL